MTEASYEAGFGSSSRAYEGAGGQLGMTPSSYLKGAVPQALALYPDLTVRQNLTYFARLRGLRGAERRSRRKRPC